MSCSGVGGVAVFAHGLAIQAQVLGDRCDRETLTDQILDDRVSLAGAHRGRRVVLLGRHRAVVCRGHRRGGVALLIFGVLGGLGGVRLEFVQVGAVCPDGLLGGVAQVVPQVPSVGDLDGLRCARSGGLGVGGGPVPADDLDLRVSA